MAHFPTTRWSLVNQAAAAPDEARKNALAALIGRYAPALKAHLLGRRRMAPEQADDLLQGFIVNEVLEKSLLKNAHSSKGKFRNLLLTALDRHVVGQHRYATRQKRHAADGVSIDAAPEPFDGNTIAPDSTFDIAWAKQVLAETLRQMESECLANDRLDVWGVFEARILGPMTGGEAPPAYEALIERLGFRSPLQAANALTTAKRMFERNLREILAEYAGDADRVEEEIRDLRAILARANR